YAAVATRSRAVAEKLSAANRVRVTSEAGTDVTFDLSGRTAIADTGDLTKPGSFGNLPAGEGFIAPVEGATTGRIVFDGAAARYGEPLVIVIDNGYAVSFEGEAAQRFRAEIEPRGREAFAVAELGVGTNEAAQLTGDVLEDEKVMGTIHVALGDNHTFGGKVRVASHIDQVVLRPTVTLDGVALLTGGELLL
ncbi:MAG TPA: aminopeptidase, partial [Actinomycetota bacterium]|nr:aminopeptidase [Actinomycetota bacterium]